MKVLHPMVLYRMALDQAAGYRTGNAGSQRALLSEGGAKVLFRHGLEHQRGGELRSRTLPTVSAL